MYCNGFVYVSVSFDILIYNSIITVFVYIFFATASVSVFVDRHCALHFLHIKYESGDVGLVKDLVAKCLHT